MYDQCPPYWLVQVWKVAAAEVRHVIGLDVCREQSTPHSRSLVM